MRILSSLFFIVSAFGGAPETRTIELPEDQALDEIQFADTLPARPDDAMGGEAFIHETANMRPMAREAAIYEQIMAGNVPAFLRALKPVRLTGKTKDGETREAIIFVTPDYLSIGSADDFVRIPMNLYTASRIARRHGFVLPTRKMVDATYAQSEVKLSPHPMKPGRKMATNGYYMIHQQYVETQMNGATRMDLVAGHKKDVVLTPRLSRKPGRIAIYGWHRQNGQPIQPLSTVHSADYADYSHGIRLVGKTALVDGKKVSLHKALQDPNLAPVFSDEGPIEDVREIMGRPAPKSLAFAKDAGTSPSH